MKDCFHEKETHTLRHKKLYQALDELFADFINTTKYTENDPIIVFLLWSQKQSKVTDHQEPGYAQ